MENGMSPQQASEEAILRIAMKEPTFSGALIAINKNGEYGGAAYNASFTYCVRNESMSSTQIVTVTALTLPGPGN